MKKPLISVIIAVYNGENYLAQTINSVLTQDYPDLTTHLELIVIDDGSTDNTREIVHRFSGPIRYVYQQNRGLASAQNLAIDLACGKYLAFLDADDFWATDKISLQLSQFNADPNIDIVFGHVSQFYSPDLSETLRQRWRCPSQAMPAYHTGSMLIRKDRFLSFGYFSTHWRAGPFIDWYAKVQEKQPNVVMLPNIILHRRIHANNMGITKQDSYTDYLKIIKASLDRRRLMGIATDAE